MSISELETHSTYPSRHFMKQGTVAGLVGGLVFGVLMALIGILPTVGMLIRQNNALVGLFIHMVISAIFGAGFGAVLSLLTGRTAVFTLVIGAVYGLFWWVLGALFLMPILLGLPSTVFVIDEMQLYSLLGHLLYGITLGIVMCWLAANAALKVESVERQRVADALRLLNTELERRVQERTAELDAERAQIKAILDAMGEGVIYNEQRRSKYINQTLSKMTGYNLEDFNETYLELLSAGKISGEGQAQLFPSIREGIHSEGIWRSEVRLRRKDGTEFDAALTCTTVEGYHSQSVGTVTIVRDISVEKQLQEQKGRFIANASHELRTPLTNFKTRLYLLRKQPEQSNLHIAALERTTNYMAGLVEDLLDITRFERGVIQLHCEDITLQDLITATVESQQLEAARKNIMLQANLFSAPLHAFADPTRLTQVLTNLLTNAINYTAEGGTISLQLLNEQDEHTPWGIIRVQDTGVGIAPEHLKRVFEPFFRINGESTQGTGLGLSISQEIMQLHGGLIAVESKPGVGSMFSVKLPITNENSAVCSSNIEAVPQVGSMG